VFAADDGEDQGDERDLEERSDDPRQPGAQGAFGVQARAREQQRGEQVGERQELLGAVDRVGDVDLAFDRFVPELSPQQLKDLLRPVFDFDSHSPVDAYLETVPPKVKDAIKNHQVLVGMNREMVLYSKGRPPKKDREKDGNTEYEEWIYGEPPHDVDFVRFVGDEVIRVETMKVDGEKVVRTEKEVNLEPQPTLADKQEQPQPRPANAPTLRRPGEEMPNASPQAPNPKVIAPPTPPVSPGPTPNSGPN